jgi:hypothetical protein
MTEQTNTVATNDEYKGFSLFSDIEDNALRTRNRAVVLANMAEGSSKNRKISPNGMALIIGYFDKIPKEERRPVMEHFIISMKERGFELQTKVA